MTPMSSPSTSSLKQRAIFGGATSTMMNLNLPALLGAHNIFSKAKWAVILGIVTLWTASRLTRWNLYNDTHRRFQGKYALTKEDEARGLKRMNKSGYRGIRDAQYILRQVTTREMPFLYQKALEYALFRTYGVPTISKILLRTGNFVQKDKSSRRYIDTMILIVSFLFYPLPRFDLEDNDAGHNRPDEDVLFENGGEDDPRSAIALARVNFLHRRADKHHRPAGAGISNEDLLYTLTVFVTQPIYWADKYAWRSLSLLEQEALFTVMYHVGRCMRIEGVPDTRESFIEWAEAFEKRGLVFSDVNHTVAVETVNLLLWIFPDFVKPALFPVVASIMDDRLRESVGFSKPPGFVALLPNSLLMTMKYYQRYLGRPRSTYAVVIPHNGERAYFLETQSPGAGCPNGTASTLEKSATLDETSRPRLLPRWYDNDPHYSKPAQAFSLRWLYEKAFVPAEQRHGALKWRRSVARCPRTGEKKDQGAATSMVCPAGYRLEECGPRGVEDLGRDEIRKEAEELHGKPIEGRWAF